MNTVSLYRKVYLQYIRYKDSPYFSATVYASILLVSIFLIYFVLVPQVTNFFSIREEISRTRERIAVMNDNIAFLMSLNDQELNQDVSLVTTALPPERDVSLLLSAINDAARQSGVLLDDFSFQAGRISSRGSAPGATEGDERAKITFNVQGSLTEITTLVTQLQQKIPLLAIAEVDATFGSNNSTEITVTYYTKALPLVQEDASLPLKPLTNQNKALLDQLQSWKVNETFDISSSSSSGSLSPF